MVLESQRHLPSLGPLSIKNQASLSVELYKRPFKGDNLGSVYINCQKSSQIINREFQ